MHETDLIVLHHTTDSLMEQKSFRLLYIMPLEGKISYRLITFVLVIESKEEVARAETAAMRRLLVK